MRRAQSNRRGGAQFTNGSLNNALVNAYGNISRREKAVAGFEPASSGYESNGNTKLPHTALNFERLGKDSNLQPPPFEALRTSTK